MYYWVCFIANTHIRPHMLTYECACKDKEEGFYIYIRVDDVCLWYEDFNWCNIDFLWNTFESTKVSLIAGVYIYIKKNPNVYDIIAFDAESECTFSCVCVGLRVGRQKKVGKVRKFNRAHAQKIAFVDRYFKIFLHKFHLILAFTLILQSLLTNLIH